jgi:hypothetical protein
MIYFAFADILAAANLTCRWSLSPGPKAPDRQFLRIADRQKQPVYGPRSSVLGISPKTED